jgi:hypothetical protein
MSPEEAVKRLNVQFAHLWMIRTFLKHADEVVEDPDLIEIPRLLYDSIRAVETSFQQGDSATYLRRMKGKLSKLKKGAELFAKEYARVSAHTNFEMASISLSGAVKTMEEILNQVQAPPSSTSTTEDPESADVE